MVNPRVVTQVTEVRRAKEIKLLCPHCHSSLFVQLDWPYLRVERQRKISEAIGEHRKLCSAAPPEAGRVYEITYPRL